KHLTVANPLLIAALKTALGRRELHWPVADATLPAKRISAVERAVDLQEASRLPHSPQNFAPGTVSLPQAGQGPPGHRSAAAGVACAAGAVVAARRRRCLTGASGIAAV